MATTVVTGKCGESVYHYLRPFVTQHVCLLPAGHKGPHKCANCEHQWKNEGEEK